MILLESYECPAGCPHFDVTKLTAEENQIETLTNELKRMENQLEDIRMRIAEMVDRLEV